METNPTFRRKRLRFLRLHLTPFKEIKRVSRCRQRADINVTKPPNERHERCFSRLRKQIKLITMKTFIRSVLLVALVSTLAPSVFAGTDGFTVPDGGSTAIMLALALGGLGALRKFRR